MREANLLNDWLNTDKVFKVPRKLFSKSFLGGAWGSAPQHSPRNKEIVDGAGQQRRKVRQHSDIGIALAPLPLGDRLWRYADQQPEIRLRQRMLTPIITDFFANDDPLSHL